VLAAELALARPADSMTPSGCGANFYLLGESVGRVALLAPFVGILRPILIDTEPRPLPQPHQLGQNAATELSGAYARLRMRTKVSAVPGMIVA
jgi:hypothetical protein